MRTQHRTFTALDTFFQINGCNPVGNRALFVFRGTNGILPCPEFTINTETRHRNFIPTLRRHFAQRSRNFGRCSTCHRRHKIRRKIGYRRWQFVLVQIIRRLINRGPVRLDNIHTLFLVCFFNCNLGTGCGNSRVNNMR